MYIYININIFTSVYMCADIHECADVPKKLWS